MPPLAIATANQVGVARTDGKSPSGSCASKLRPACAVHMGPEAHLLGGPVLGPIPRQTTHHGADYGHLAPARSTTRTSWTSWRCPCSRRSARAVQPRVG